MAMRRWTLGSFLLAFGCSSGTEPEPARDPFEGNCQATFPGSVLEDFIHAGSAITVAAGPANHSFRDAIVAPGAAGSLQARFEYGAMSAELEDERAEFWIQRCPGWESLGIVATDEEGAAQVAVPTSLPKGDYRVRAVVLGDGTIADGSLAVWPADVEIILTSIDSTLTTAAFGSLGDVMGGTTPTMIPGAGTVMSTWASKDYRIVYLAARPRTYHRHIRTWLANNGFPAGPVHLTDGTVELGEPAKQQFVEDVVDDLRTRVDVRVVRAYASSNSDIAGYQLGNIIPSITFTIGAHAGQGLTTPISGDYTAHLAFVTSYAPADQP